MPKPELSIVIISFNTKQITLDCIESIKKSLRLSTSYEIVVVDNASSDGSVEMLKHLQKQTKIPMSIIFNKENFGFGAANNQGVKKALGEYVFLLNSDTVTLDNSIEKLLSYYKNNKDSMQFLGAKLLNTDLTPQASCGPFYTLPVVFGALFLRGDYWGLTRYSPTKSRRVDWISGACILTTKEYFLELRGFDPNIFMYFEEIDLLYRAKQKGYKTFFYPEAKFIHVGSASSRTRTEPILQVYKGFIFFYKKHYSLLALKTLRFLLQLKAVIALTIGKLSGNTYLIKTYEKAYEVAHMD